jgi:hypothetical protein
MAVFVLAGLLGFLGSGWASRRAATAADGTVHVEYERFLRRGNRTSLRVRIRSPQPGGPGLRLRLAQAYLEGMRVEGIFPAPRRTQAGPDHVSLEFDVGHEAAPLTVMIHLLPERVGPWRAAIGVDGGASLGFHQWVYP